MNVYISIYIKVYIIIMNDTLKRYCFELSPRDFKGIKTKGKIGV